jgi:alanine racemase
VVHIPLRLKIDGTALADNWRTLARLSGSAACGAAVKANGYGLGAYEVVRHLAAAGCRDFYVATWAEAAALMPWDEGLTLSVLHGVGPDDLPDALESPARPVLNGVAQVARWRDAAPGRSCELMIDTGMNRLGLTIDDVSAELLEDLAVESVASHLACADEPGHPLNALQLHRFEAIRQSIPAPRYSLANSAGIFLGPDYAFDLTRPGLALYGGIPVPDDPVQKMSIRPVVAIEAQLVQVRLVPAGETVGYGATYVAPSERKVGILNIGYADGYLRMLGRAGCAHFDGHACPVIGRVSMDLIAVDLSDAGEGAREGDWIGVDYGLADLAAGSELSQYELLTGLGERLDRRWH